MGLPNTNRGDRCMRAISREIVIPSLHSALHPAASRDGKMNMVSARWSWSKRLLSNPKYYADNTAMGFRFRRSVKLFPGLRLNFGKRGISASIGVRGAHVTYGPTGTRTTVGLPGSGLSYTHLEKPHRKNPAATTAESPTDPGAPRGNARRGFLWIGLIVVALAIAVGHLTTPSPPVQVSAPTQTPVQTAARATDDDEATTAETRRAALGITQIRHAVANSNTLKLSRVTAMPTGAICYQFHLQNSRGVTYVRTAVLNGAVLKTSGSDGFTVLWTRLCTHQSRRDITSEVENAMKLSAK